MTWNASHRLIVCAASLLLLIIAPYAEAQMPGADANLQHTSQQDEDAELNQAKEAYATRIAEVEKSVARQVEDALQKARRSAQKAKESKLSVASALLLVAYDSAIQRAIESGDLDYASRLTVEKQSFEGHGINAPVVDTDQFSDKTIYKCVLGIYGRYARDASYPVVNLSVPNRDLWSIVIQSRLHGKIDFFEINYKGNAKLIVPENAIYVLDIPSRGTSFELNGKTLVRGDVELKKGVYCVQITTGTHGQQYLPDSFIQIFHKETKQELPLVNTGSDIKRFLSSTIADQTVVEVSGYIPEVVDPALLGFTSTNEIADDASSRDAAPAGL